MCYDCARILSCPAIRRTEIEGKETMQIDEDRCIKCGVCYEICPNNAIQKTRVKALEKEVPL